MAVSSLSQAMLSLFFLLCSRAVHSFTVVDVRPNARCGVIGCRMHFSPNSNHDDNNDDDAPQMSTSIMNRRDAVLSTAAAMIVAGASSANMMIPVQPAQASGGATAGRYTTIPIAKRRYYGRVQQGVHEFLEMGPYAVKGDLTAESVQRFFDPEGAVIVQAKRKDIGGQCTKKDGDCRGREIRDSRYNDMKASMYLLGNAFRTDQQKPPDRLPTVKAARAFFKEMDDLEKLVRKKNPKSNDLEAAKKYGAALDILDQYLDLVELPPTESGHYDKEFDTLVGETARIT